MSALQASPKDHDEVRLARRVMLAGALLYPLWAHVSVALIPGSHEWIAERYVVGAAFFGSWVLSHLSAWGRTHAPRLLFGCFLLLTAHYFWLVHSHDMSPMYAIGAFIVVCSINACLTTLREFRWYSTFVLVTAAVVTAAAESQRALSVVMLLGMATQQLLVFISLHARVDAMRKLAAAQGELQQANVDLRQADRYKDNFLAIISHELRTPLNAVLGFGSVLDDGVVGELTTEQRRYVKKILAAADDQLRLVSDLLDMSRIQAGKFSLELQPIQFSELAHEVLTRLGPLSARDGLRLVNGVPADLPPLRADEQRIGQVLSNLVGNALKFSPPGGTVRVQACVQDASLRCEVADSGAGIAPKDLGKLFQPFSQVDSGPTRKSGGTGLGLSISKALVEAHGGAIGVDSVPGHGCTFWFTLPLERTVAEEQR